MGEKIAKKKKILLHAILHAIYDIYLQFFGARPARKWFVRKRSHLKYMEAASLQPITFLKSKGNTKHQFTAR